MAPAARNRVALEGTGSSHSPDDVPKDKARLAKFAPAVAVISCLLFCCNGQLLQALQGQLDPSEGRPSTLVNLALCHLGGLVFWPQALQSQGDHRPEVDLRLSSLCIALLIMAYNYAWLSSTHYISVGLTTAIFRTSSGMMYCASVFWFSEPLALGRVCGVVLSFLGMALACGMATLSPHVGASSSGYGACLALLAAVGVTAYQVLFKHLYNHRGSDISFLMRFNFWVSVWHVLAVIPAIKLADVCGFESLELPVGRMAVAGTAVSAVIASTVNMMNLAVVQWGSPMLLPCAYNLSVPLSIYLDAMFHGVVPEVSEAVGHVLIVLSVLLILDLPIAMFGISAIVGRVRLPWRPALGKDRCSSLEL